MNDRWGIRSARIPGRGRLHASDSGKALFRGARLVTCGGLVVILPEMMRCVLPLAAVVCFTACGGVRRQLSNAAELEQGGMMEQAHAAYAAVHDRRPREVKALVGMKRTAQARYDRIAQDASAAYLVGDRAAGDALYEKAARVLAEAQRDQLDLRVDTQLEQRRQEALTTWVRATFEQALEAFRNDRFEECQRLCEQVLRVEKDMSDAASLRRMAELEPLYREAHYAAELGLWRTAYRIMKRVTDSDPGYKQAWTDQDRYRTKATWTLAYVPLINVMMYSGGMLLTSMPGQIESSLRASIKQSILELDDPLIVLVDRENTDQLLAEQQRSMEGIYDEVYAARAGRLLGARYTLSVRINRFDDILSKQAEVQMTLLDNETGAINLSKVVRVNKEELARGAPRAQLIDRVARRIAEHVGGYDPFAR